MATVLNDETLMAYVDGELPPDQEEEILRLLAGNPDAQATIAMMQKSRDLLRTVFEPVLQEPIPPQLLEVIRTSAPGCRRTAAKERKVRISRFIPKPALPWAAAIALIAGGLAAYIGSQYLHTNTGDPVPMAAVDAFLGEALEYTASGAIFTHGNAGSADLREVMPRLSFRSHDGRFCREYEDRLPLSGDTEVRYGIACREEGLWRDVGSASLQEIAPHTAPPTDDHYTPAGDQENKKNVDGLVDQIMQGVPLTPDEEARLLRNGWIVAD